MLVGASACLSIVSRRWHDSVPACVHSSVRSPRLCLETSRLESVPHAGQTPGQGITNRLGGWRWGASRLHSNGHSRGLRIACILMRQRRASESRTPADQHMRREHRV